MNAVHGPTSPDQIPASTQQDLRDRYLVEDLFVPGSVRTVVTHYDRVVAVGMWDPFARANVMARGLVGSSLVDGEEVPVLFSPMYKQAFDLRTGVCLSDPAKALGTWAVAVLDSRVFVGSQVTDEAPLRRPEEGLARAG